MTDSPFGSPTHLDSPDHEVIPGIVNRRLTFTHRHLTKQVRMPTDSSATPYFVIAVAKTDHDAPFADVTFGLDGFQLRDRLRALRAKFVTFAVLDADDFGVQIIEFLAPFGLSAPHHWAVELQEQLGEFLVMRCKVTYKCSEEVAREKVRMRSLHAVRECLGITRDRRGTAVRWAK